MHILLHGGTVVSAEGTAVLDVLIEDGRIAAVGEHLPAGDAQVVDCAGKLLFPGFIDGHNRLPPPAGGADLLQGFPGGEMDDDDRHSFKMYMTYPAMMIPEGDMYHALLRLKEAGGITGVHCENDGEMPSFQSSMVMWKP